MKEVKLFNLLKNLSRKELNELENFVTSKVFNRNKALIKLYKFILLNPDKFKNGSISKYSIFSYVFGNEKYKETKYWKLISAFALVIDKYLIYKEFEIDHYYHKNHLLEAYRRRNINKQFSFLSKEIQKNFSNEFNKGLNFFLNQTHYYFQNISYLGERRDKDLDDEIEKLFENLKMFFIMVNITSVSIISNLKKDFILNSVSDVWLFKDLIDYFQRNKAYIKKNYLTVYIFFLIILSKLHFEKEEYYFEAKKLILLNRDMLSENLMRHMLVSILAYSVSKLIKGDEKFLKEIFSINKIMDDNSLTLFGEVIQEDYYYSVIEHATMLKQNVWAKDFAEKYKFYLSPESRESAADIGIARIYFENKDYNSSLKLLLKVENISPYFYLSHKILLIQNYYELGEIDSISHLLETSGKYLKRHIDLTNELKENYVKFFFYVRKLKAVSSNRRYLAKNLVNELQKEKFFLQKNWLLEKALKLK